MPMKLLESVSRSAWAARVDSSGVRARDEHAKLHSGVAADAMQRVVAVCNVTENLVASVAGFFRGEGVYIAQNHSAIAPEARVVRSNAARLNSQDES